MANILGGVPWLGIPQVRLNADLAGNFMRGIQTGVGIRESAQRRDLEERKFDLERRQVEAIETAKNAQVLASQLDFEEKRQKLRSALLQEERSVKAQGAMNELAELGELMSMSDSWGDEEQFQRVWRLAGRVPELMETDQFKQMIGYHEAVKKLKHEKMTPSAPFKQLTELMSFNEEIARRKAAGQDTTQLEAQADLLMQAFPVRDAFSGEIRHPTTGEVMVRFQKGGRGEVEPTRMTPAVQTQLQQGFIKMNEVSSGLHALSKTLTPDAVGVRGVIQGELFNKLLAQVAPQFHKEGVRATRAQIATLNERIMEDLKTSGQLSDKDAARLQKALAGLGPIESFQGVQEWMSFWNRELGVIGGQRAALALGKSTADITFDDLGGLRRQGLLSDVMMARIIMSLDIPIPEQPIGPPIPK